MLPNLMKLAICIDFKINQDFIAEELCINKDKPELGCKGKCYLSNQLNEVEETNNKNIPENYKELFREVYYIKGNFDFSVFVDTAINPMQKTFYQEEIYSFSSITDVFHPPQII